MKSKKFILLGIFALLINYTHLKAQDTIIEYNNYKWKLGGKFIIEKSGDYSLAYDNSDVTSGGMQIVYKLFGTRSSLESGIYYLTKAHRYLYHQNINSSGVIVPIKYKFISVPLMYRYDTRIFYFAVGLHLDYLASIASENEFYLNLLDRGTDRKLQMAAAFTAGFEKSIYDYMNIFFEGRFASNLTASKTEEELFKTSYTNYGFALGLNFKLLK
jgi:hypothetical protein